MEVGGGGKITISFGVTTEILDYVEYLFPDEKKKNVVFLTIKER